MWCAMYLFPYFKMKNFQINKKFIETVIGKIFPDNQVINQEEIYEFTDLLETLLRNQNQPKMRNGYRKAHILAKWLTDKGVTTKVISVENLDSRKKANLDNKWYLVESVVGESKPGKKTINGLMLVHHDQVAKTIDDFKRTQTGKKVFHPWILDDSIHVAAAMMEIVNFNNWWKENCNNFQIQPSIRLIISDGEEMNTLGIRAMLKLWKKHKSLKPVHFMIIGETTGSSDGIPGLACTNSGKELGLITNNDKNKLTCEKILDFLVRFRIAQKYIYLKSQIDNHSKIPRVDSSRLSSTFGKLSQKSEFFWEARTNNIYGTEKSFKTLKKIMTKDSKGLRKYFSEVVNCEKRLIPAYNLDLANTFKYANFKKHYIVQIKTKKSYHPGAYNPFNLDDIYSALEIFLFHLKKEELCKLKDLFFGDRDKPNTVSNSLYLVFQDDIDLRTILERIKNAGTGLYKQINSNYENYLISAKKAIKWKVKQDEFTPARDGLGDYSQNKWLSDIVRNNFDENFEATTREKVRSPLTVFNAMHDGGFTTCKEYKKKLWKYGENAIVFGTGDFSILHDKEYLTHETFIYGMLEYKNLLQKCYLSCACY